MPIATSGEHFRRLVAAAGAAARPVRATPPNVRAGWLEAIATALDDAQDALVPIARRETAIAEARLAGELRRTTGQLRMFAEVCRDGSFAGVIRDAANPSAQPAPIPDLHRMLVPLGPVAVFAASNFPFAFSVAGGDTASALAAGCPVVVKAHPGHPELSDATVAVVGAALETAGAPPGVLGLVHGIELGRELVQEPVIKAVGFTGSLAGGRALFDLASSRPDPIPFYGELGSINPVFVTASASRGRAAEIAAGFVASYTTNMGQMCTKPGLLFVPRGSAVTEEATVAAAHVEMGRMLNDHVASTFATAVRDWLKVPGVEVLSGFRGSSGPLLVKVAAALLAEHESLLEEAFGPAAIIVEYDGQDDLLNAAERVPPSLSAAVFAAEGDPELDELVPLLVESAGRIVWNGWTTGVAVTRGQHHGGPYPSTTSVLHTSVGAMAILRWLRPVVFQGWPTDLLPTELRDANVMEAAAR